MLLRLLGELYLIINAAVGELDDMSFMLPMLPIDEGMIFRL